MEIWKTLQNFTQTSHQKKIQEFFQNLGLIPVFHVFHASTQVRNKFVVHTASRANIYA